MTDGSAAECVPNYASGAEMDTKLKHLTVRLKSIPWARVVVDTLLVVSVLLASSSLLTVR